MDNTLLSEKTHVSVQQPSSSSFEDEKLSKHLICPTCNKSFLKKFCLTRHMKIHSDVKPNICYVCEKAFASLYHLKRHLETHRKIPIRYKCEHCIEIFKRKFELVKHERVFHHKAEYPCNECSITFQSNYAFLNHKRKNHKNTLHTYCCNVCTDTFANKRHLSKHKRNMHAIEIKCDECSESFQYKYEFLQHKRKNHKKTLNMYFCNVCTDTFTNKRHLSKHKRNMHPIQITCDECSESFQYKYEFLQHKRKNHPKDFHVCGKCNEQTSTNELPTANNENLDLLNFLDNFTTECMNDVIDFSTDNFQNENTDIELKNFVNNSNVEHMSQNNVATATAENINLNNFNLIQTDLPLTNYDHESLNLLNFLYDFNTECMNAVNNIPTI